MPAVITATVPDRGGGGAEHHSGERAALRNGARSVAQRRADGRDGFDLRLGRPGQEDGPDTGGEELPDDGRAVFGCLAGPVDGFGHSLAQISVVVDPGETEIGIGQPAQLAHRVVRRAPAVGNGFDERAE